MRVWHRSIIVAAIVFGTIAGAIVGLQSPRVAQNLKDRIEQTARDSYGLSVEIKGLELTLLPPGLAFKKVEVRRPDQKEPWVKIYRGEVRVQPWPSAAGAVVVDHLELDGLEINHRWDPDAGPWDDFGEGRLPVDIRELLIWNARFFVASDDRTGRFEGVDLVLESHPDGGRRINLDLPAGQVSIGERAFTIEARSQARLFGTLDRPESLKVERAKIFLPQIALLANGSVALGEADHEPGTEGDNSPESAGMVLTVEGGVSLPRLRDLFPTLPDLRGHAELKAEIRGDTADPFAPPLVRFAADISKMAVEGRTLGDVHVNAVYETNQLNLESFRASHPITGTLTGSGRIDLTLDNPEVTLTARVHRLSLPAVLVKGGFDEVWVKLQISGDIEGTGTWDGQRFDGRTTAYGEEFAVLDRDFRDPEAEAILYLERVDVSGPFTLRKDGVLLRGVDVVRGETRLTVGGFLSFNPNVGLDLNVAGEQVNMADVGAIADVPFAGTGTIFAALEGAYGPEITISGTVEMEDFGVLDIPIGDTRGTVIFEYPTLSVDRAKIKRGRGTAAGSGWISFDPMPPQTHARFNLWRVDLGGLFVSAGVDPDFARRVRAATSGRARLDGRLTDPSGQIELQSDAVTLDAVALGAATATISLDGDRRRGDRIARMVIKADPGGGALTTTVGVHAPSPDNLELALAVDAKKIPFPTVTPLLDDVPLLGTFSATANLRGPAGALNGELAISVPDFAAWGVAFQDTAITGQAVGGKTKLKGVFGAGRGTLAGTMVLGRRLPFITDVNLEQIPVHEAYPLPRDLTVVVSGTVFSQGDLTRPEEISAAIDLEEVVGALEGIELALARPAHLSWGNRRLNILDLAFTGTRLNMGIRGLVTADKELELGVRANGDLGVAAPFFGPIEEARGPFTANFAITGPWHVPFISGGVQIRDGRLKSKGLRQALTQVTGELDFSGRNVELNNLAARLGGGTVVFSGGALLPTAREPAQLSLFADFDRVTVEPQAGMAATGSGSGSVTGPMGNLALNGRVFVDELRYSRNLELSIDSFFPRRDAPLKVPDFAPGQTMTVDVHVEAPGNLHLVANAINVEFKADLDFRGTTDSLGLLGRLTPLRGKARYSDLEFTYERGDITFTEEFRIQADIDLTAKAEGCDMVLTLNIEGDSHGEPHFELTGEDENGPVPELDPWSCVQYGFRISEQDAGQLASQDILGTNSSGLREVASGIDLLCEVSGLCGRIRQLVPYLDETRVRLGRSGRGRSTRTAPRLVVRKDVGSRLQLKYDGALDDVDDHIVSLEYELSPVAAIQGAWVSLSDVPVGDFGLDLRLRWEFD